MAIPSKIPKETLKKVQVLEARFRDYLSAGNLKKAKLALNELNKILSGYGHNARIMQAYLMFYEAALEQWEIDLAKRGFQFVRNNTNNNTRLHLEATTLLAIAYLRDRDTFSAEPLMAEVLRNETVIKSERQRQLFRFEVIDRFDQEGALAALSNCYPEHKAEAEVHREALEILRKGKTDSEIEETIGSSVPQEVKDFLLKVDQLSKNLLPHDQRLLLPSPKEMIKNRNLGNILFRGVKRKVYNSICDEKSEVYQAWLRNGLDAILSKGYVASAVIAALVDYKVVMGSLAVGVSALLMNQGIGNFCERNKPKDLMALRANSSKKNQADA